MDPFSIKKYTSDQQNQWNDFIGNSKNGSFLFNRNFMDYHADRFEDFSLMVYEKKKLIAVLPANKKANKVISHQGLTYGGVVLSKKIKFEKVISIYKSLLYYLSKQGIQNLRIKLLPKIYHTYPSDEIDYLLFLLKGNLVRADLSSTIYLPEKSKIQSNRMEGVKKAEKEGLQLENKADFSSFWEEILIPNLMERHQAKPTHSLDEIEKLARKFQKNIHQYNVIHQGKIVGGCTVFETKTVAHIQYISADHQKQQLGTLDFLFHHLIEKEFGKKIYFDFGISNENQGLNLNKGLLYWKESFGARAIVYPTYEIETRNHILLDKVFL